MENFYKLIEENSKKKNYKKLFNILIKNLNSNDNEENIHLRVNEMIIKYESSPYVDRFEGGFQ
jgi:hypothetical protein